MHPGDDGLGIIVTEVNDPPLSHGDLENYRHVLSLIVADGVRGEGGELDASDGGLRTRQRDRKSSKGSVGPLRRLSLVRAVDPSRLKLKPTIDTCDVLIDEPVRRGVRKKARRVDIKLTRLTMSLRTLPACYNLPSGNDRACRRPCRPRQAQHRWREEGSRE